MFDELNDKNVMMFAIRHYSNPKHRGEEEFEEDFKKFKLMNKLLNVTQVNHRLVLNTIIVLQNTFSTEGVRALLFYYTKESHFSILKSFMVYLGYLSVDEMSNINMDKNILKELEGV
jgi:hypothetical protein